MKVLVVDDDVISRMVLMHLIDSCGTFDILEAEDGADAWERLERGLRPAICFCDLRMPRLSGMDLLARVRAEPSMADMPFILVSSATDNDTMRQASGLGAAGYIVKPFQAEQVRVHLAALCGPAAPSPHHAEAPLDTMERLGINAERLLVYLGGYQNQLAAASAELAALLAAGDPQAAALRLERLRLGGETLGLTGVVDRFKAVPAALPGVPELDLLLADAVRAVLRQSDIVRRNHAPA
ncbi:response regulator [Massilia glaciei]|uniref:Response regulator n=1 Tax=Massilia glaciei TaxID=1524097 RepID=A0A2U2I4H8_9BURK|nr:response regulator [Massilia glaciei]PWF54637.1 response regulator [Massilia glaciei]